MRSPILVLPAFSRSRLGWKNVEERRLEDSEEWSAETSDSMDSSSELIESDDEDEYEDMSDVPDPLDY